MDQEDNKLSGYCNCCCCGRRQGESDHVFISLADAFRPLSSSTQEDYKVYNYNQMCEQCHSCFGKVMEKVLVNARPNLIIKDWTKLKKSLSLPAHHIFHSDRINYLLDQTSAEDFLKFTNYMPYVSGLVFEYLMERWNVNNNTTNKNYNSIMNQPKDQRQYRDGNNNKEKLSIGAISDTTDAIVLMVDVTGYTALAELFCEQRGVNLGVETLVTKCLNNYFTKLIGTIYEYGGDVVKFAGDALVCVWKPQIAPSMYNNSSNNDNRNSFNKTNFFESYIQVATLCANKCKTLKETVKIGETVKTLEVHCGVAFGKISILTVGNSSGREILITGTPLKHAGKAVELAAAGNVVIHRSVWNFINSIAVCKISKIKNKLDVTKVDDKAKKILGIEMNDECIVDTDQKEKNKVIGHADSAAGGSCDYMEENNNFNSKKSFKKKQINKIQCSNICQEQEQQIIEKTNSNFKDEANSAATVAVINDDDYYCILDLLVNEDLDYSNNKFKQMHQTQPLRQLPFEILQKVMESYVPSHIVKRWDGSRNHANDVRLVSTLFINIANDAKSLGYETHIEEIELLQEIFLVARRIVNHHGGMIRQFIVDDKGCVLIVCFGVSTYRHKDDASRAVATAVDLQRTLSAMKDNKNINNNNSNNNNSSLCCDSIVSSALKISIGISTGRSFCGPIGSIAFLNVRNNFFPSHPDQNKLDSEEEKRYVERREFSVVGNCVNLAARIMKQAFEINEGILCDPVTEEYVKLDIGGFEQGGGQWESNNCKFSFDLIKKVKMKGVAGIVNLYRPSVQIIKNNTIKSKTQQQQYEQQKSQVEKKKFIYESKLSEDKASIKDILNNDVQGDNNKCTNNYCSSTNYDKYDSLLIEKSGNISSENKHDYCNKCIPNKMNGNSITKIKSNKSNNSNNKHSNNNDGLKALNTSHSLSPRSEYSCISSLSENKSPKQKYDNICVGRKEAKSFIKNHISAFTKNILDPFIIIQGEEGMGKTNLLQWLRNEIKNKKQFGSIKIFNGYSIHGNRLRSYHGGLPQPISSNYFIPDSLFSIGEGGRQHQLKNSIAYDVGLRGFLSDLFEFKLNDDSEDRKILINMIIELQNTIKNLPDVEPAYKLFKPNCNKLNGTAVERTISMDISGSNMIDISMKGYKDDTLVKKSSFFNRISSKRASRINKYAESMDAPVREQRVRIKSLDVNAFFKSRMPELSNNINRSYEDKVRKIDFGNNGKKLQPSPKSISSLSDTHQMSISTTIQTDSNGIKKTIKTTANIPPSSGTTELSFEVNKIENDKNDNYDDKTITQDNFERRFSNLSNFSNFSNFSKTSRSTGGENNNNNKNGTKEKALELQNYFNSNNMSQHIVGRLPRTGSMDTDASLYRVASMDSGIFPSSSSSSSYDNESDDGYAYIEANSVTPSYDTCSNMEQHPDIAVNMMKNTTTASSSLYISNINNNIEKPPIAPVNKKPKTKTMSSRFSLRKHMSSERKIINNINDKSSRKLLDRSTSPFSEGRKNSHESLKIRSESIDSCDMNNDEAFLRELELLEQQKEHQDEILRQIINFNEAFANCSFKFDEDVLQYFITTHPKELASLIFNLLVLTEQQNSPKKSSSGKISDGTLNINNNTSACSSSQNSHPKSSKILFLVVMLLLEQCKNTKSCLIIDDVEWLDEMSMELLRNIIKYQSRNVATNRRDDGGLMIITTMRNKNVSQVQTKLGLFSTHLVCPYKLLPLNENEIQELLDQKFNICKNWPKTAIQSIMKSSDGLPLWSIEYARGLLARKYVQWDEVENEWIFDKNVKIDDIFLNGGSGLEGAILQRFDNLEQEIWKQAFQWACVMEYDFTVSIIRDLLIFSQIHCRINELISLGHIKEIKTEDEELFEVHNEHHFNTLGPELNNIMALVTLDSFPERFTIHDVMEKRLNQIDDSSYYQNIIDELCREGFIQMFQKVGDEILYTISHEYYCRAVYLQIPSGEVTRFHLQTAKCLSGSRNNNDNIAPLLAYHYGKAGDWKNQIRCLSKAAKFSLRHNQIFQAKDYLFEAITIANKYISANLNFLNEFNGIKLIYASILNHLGLYKESIAFLDDLHINLVNELSISKDVSPFSPTAFSEDEGFNSTCESPLVPPLSATASGNNIANFFSTKTTNEISSASLNQITCDINDNNVSSVPALPSSSTSNSNSSKSPARTSSFSHSLTTMIRFPSSSSNWSLNKGESPSYHANSFDSLPVRGKLRKQSKKSKSQSTYKSESFSSNTSNTNTNSFDVGHNNGNTTSNIGKPPLLRANHSSFSPFSNANNGSSSMNGGGSISPGVPPITNRSYGKLRSSSTPDDFRFHTHHSSDNLLSMTDFEDETSSKASGFSSSTATSRQRASSKTPVKSIARICSSHSLKGFSISPFSTPKKEETTSKEVSFIFDNQEWLLVNAMLLDTAFFNLEYDVFKNQIKNCILYMTESFGIKKDSALIHLLQSLLKSNKMKSNFGPKLIDDLVNRLEVAIMEKNENITKNTSEQKKMSEFMNNLRFAIGLIYKMCLVSSISKSEGKQTRDQNNNESFLSKAKHYFKKSSLSKIHLFHKHEVDLIFIGISGRLRNGKYLDKVDEDCKKLIMSSMTLKNPQIYVWARTFSTLIHFRRFGIAVSIQDFQNAEYNMNDSNHNNITDNNNILCSNTKYGISMAEMLSNETIRNRLSKSSSSQHSLDTADSGNSIKNRPILSPSSNEVSTQMFKSIDDTLLKVDRALWTALKAWKSGDQNNPNYNLEEAKKQVRDACSLIDCNLSQQTMVWYFGYIYEILFYALLQVIQFTQRQNQLYRRGSQNKKKKIDYLMM